MTFVKAEMCIGIVSSFLILSKYKSPENSGNLEKKGKTT